MATKTKSKHKRTETYSAHKNPMEFYVREDSATYNATKPFSVYYDNPEHSLKLLKGDCIDILNQARENSVDMIFADPPYFLSNGGITCHSGKMVSVNKGAWDKSKGVEETHQFNIDWLKACQRVLKPDGAIWISGTPHIIHSIGYAMQKLKFKLLNDIVWFKVNPAPNLACRYFTHSTETIIWAAKSLDSKHVFNYGDMKAVNGKQMKNVWQDLFWAITPPRNGEKKFGKHPTQKPVELLTRIIQASTKEGDLVLDPFCGSSTTGVAAHLNNRKYVGIDKEAEYLELSVKRLKDTLSEKHSNIFSYKKIAML